MPDPISKPFGPPAPPKPPPKPPAPRPLPPKADRTTYEVREGDNLTTIAERLSGHGVHTDVASIVKANHIANPDLIFPHQKLSIPLHHDAPGKAPGAPAKAPAPGAVPSAPAKPPAPGAPPAHGTAPAPGTPSASSTSPAPGTQPQRRPDAPGMPEAPQDPAAAKQTRAQQDVIDGKAVDDAIRDATPATPMPAAAGAYDAAPAHHAKDVVDRLAGSAGAMTPAQQDRLYASLELKTLLQQHVAPAYLDRLAGGLDLGNGGGVNGAAQARSSLAALDTASANAPPRLARLMVQPEIDALKQTGFGTTGAPDGNVGIIGREGTQNLMNVLDRVTDTSTGQAWAADDAGRRMQADALDLHFDVRYVQDIEMQALAGRGKLPQLSLAYTQLFGQDAMTGLPGGIQGVVQDGLPQSIRADMQKLQEHTKDLDWYVQNLGGSMTSAQLDAAVGEYVKNKEAAEPGWSAQRDRLQDRIADDGQAALKLMSLLKADGARDPLHGRIADVLANDPTCSAAIGIALQQRPQLATSPEGHSLIHTLAYATKTTDAGANKLVRDLTNAYVRDSVLGPLQQAVRSGDTIDAAKLAQAGAQLDRLAADPDMAKLLGIETGGKRHGLWAAAVDAVKKQLPAEGDTQAVIGQKAQQAAKAIDAFESDATGDTKRLAFDRSTTAGQLLRGIGVFAAGVSFAATAPALVDGKTDLADGKPFLDAASFGSGILKIMVGQERIEQDTFLGALGSGNKRIIDPKWFGKEGAVGDSLDSGRLMRADRIIGYAGALYDTARAVQSLQGPDADPAQATLYGVGAAGSTLATLSNTTLLARLGAGAWAGPVGISLTVASVIGQVTYQHVKDSNVHMNDETARFLAHAGTDERGAGGLSPAASKALVDQSGEGFSPVPVLLAYAKDKGVAVDQPAGNRRFVDWINAMPPEQLEHLRDRLHRTLDRWDGDVSKLSPDTTVTPPQETRYTAGANPYGAPMPRTVDAPPATVGQIDAVLQQYGIPALA